LIDLDGGRWSTSSAVALANGGTININGGAVG